MEPKYVYSESTEKPKEIEITDFGNVFLRKEISSETRDEVVYYTYMEGVLTVEEFNAYASHLTMTNAVKGVDNADNIKQLVAGQNSNDFNQMAIMEAIATLYDEIETLKTSINK